MIIYALLFVAGILGVQQLPELPGYVWLGVISICGIVFAVLRYSRIVFIILGVLWAIFFAMHRLDDRLASTLESIEIPVTGIILGLPVQDKRRSSFDFKVTESAYKLPNKIHLSWYFPDQDIKAGQVWKFLIKLKRPHGSLNPGGYDYERYLFSQGVGAIGYIRTDTKPQLMGRLSGWTSISIWRQAIADALTQLLPNSPNLGLIKALTIGDGSGISKADWDTFRKTGTTHLVVISGSHVGLIAGLAYLITLKLWVRVGYLKWAPQTVAACVAMVIGFFYAALAGFSVPTQRAVVMLIVWMLAIILQRNSKPLNTLAVALFAVLLYDPLSVLSVGFWLSFLAVSLMVYVLSGRLGKQSYWLEMLKINMATSIGLSPLLLLFFQQISLISPLANFIAVPLISFISVPLALLGVVLMWFSQDLAMLLLWLADYSLQGLKLILQYFAEFSLATFNQAQPPVWSLLFSIPAVLLLLAPVGVPYRYLSFLLFLPLFATTQDKPAEGTIKLTVLDVGQALAIVVQTQQHTLIYDTGSKYSEDSNSGKTVILPFLRHEAIQSIDKLMISHGDNDHIGGAASVLAELPVTEVTTSAMAQLQHYQPVKCVAGQTWVWDKVQFNVLAPGHDFSSDNDNSCVLQIKTITGIYLLPSDIEASAEAWLTHTYGQQLKADVLISPHHGSKTSSTSAFLKAVNPELVVISSGYLNQFHHPHPDVIARYKQNNMTWLNTAEQGALTITEAQGVKHLVSTRDTEGKYWNNK